MTQDADKCKGLWGALFGHKFVARYDKDNSVGREGEWSSFDIPREILDAALVTEALSDILQAAQAEHTKSTYIHDVCVRCGKVVHRGSVQNGGSKA